MKVIMTVYIQKYWIQPLHEAAYGALRWHSAPDSPYLHETYPPLLPLRWNSGYALSFRHSKQQQTLQNGITHTHTPIHML
jgi:hypothetical protein